MEKSNQKASSTYNFPTPPISMDEFDSEETKAMSKFKEMKQAIQVYESVINSIVDKHEFLSKHISPIKKVADTISQELSDCTSLE